jgi:hypothetical protein
MKFGRAHRVVTTAPAAFGILALVGSVPLPGSAPVQVVVELLVVAQVVALASRRVAAYDTVVFVLALVHVLAAATLGGGALSVVALLGITAVLPAALVSTSKPGLAAVRSLRTLDANSSWESHASRRGSPRPEFTRGRRESRATRA